MDVPLDAEARVNLWFAAQPIQIEAGTLFFRDWAVFLPPASSATATMRCELPRDISLLYATSHMHRRGVEFHSDVTPPTGPAFSLHESDSWSAPTPTVFWPPVELAAGSTLEFGCEFHNDSASPVVEGTSADTDEMCVLVGGYWPKLTADAELCIGDGSGPVLAGSRTCEQVVDCMVDAGVDNWVGGSSASPTPAPPPRRPCRASSSASTATTAGAIRAASPRTADRSTRVAPRRAATDHEPAHMVGRSGRSQAASIQVSGNGGVPVTVAVVIPPGSSFGIVNVAVRLIPGGLLVVFLTGRLIVTRLPSICDPVTFA